MVKNFHGVVGHNNTVGNRGCTLVANGAKESGYGGIAGY
jgi:hypothetical protein